jgi:hypothetical protein
MTAMTPKSEFFAVQHLLESTDLAKVYANEAFA